MSRMLIIHMTFTSGTFSPLHGFLNPAGDRPNLALSSFCFSIIVFSYPFHLYGLSLAALAFPCGIFVCAGPVIKFTFCPVSSLHLFSSRGCMLR